MYALLPYSRSFIFTFNTALNNPPWHTAPSLRRLPNLGAHREANLFQPLHHCCSRRQQLPALSPTTHSLPIRFLPHPLRPLNALFPPLHPLPDLLTPFPISPVRTHPALLEAEFCEHGATCKFEYEAISHPHGNLGIRCSSCCEKFGLGSRCE